MYQQTVENENKHQASKAGPIEVNARVISRRPRKVVTPQQCNAKENIHR